VGSGARKDGAATGLRYESLKMRVLCNMSRASISKIHGYSTTAMTLSNAGGAPKNFPGSWTMIHVYKHIGRAKKYYRLTRARKRISQRPEREDCGRGWSASVDLDTSLRPPGALGSLTGSRPSHHCFGSRCLAGLPSSRLVRLAARPTAILVAMWVFHSPLVSR